jgi:MFS superfamily sulfate permease-like transporter
MPTIYWALVCGIFVAIALFIRKISRRPKVEETAAEDSISSRLPSRGRSNKHVLWDATDPGAAPVVHNGIVYIDRRSALVRVFGSLLAFVGFAALSQSAEALSGRLESSDQKQVTGTSGDHFDVPSNHSDTPHNDQPGTPHTDLGSYSNGDHTDTGGVPHGDNSHYDQNTPHTDQG